jgi:hypothetical protein
MSERVVCQGCGQRIAVPDDYRRNKMQCPECGVITPVELANRKSTTKKQRSEDTPFDTAGAPSVGNALAPPPKPAPEPDIAAIPDITRTPTRPKPSRATTTPAKQPVEAITESPVWTCSFCGEWQTHAPRGKRACCPVCKTPIPKPAKTPTTAITAQLMQARASRVAVPQTDWSDDPEDSKPYRVNGHEQPACPGCGKPMEPQAILCLHCGLDLRAGAKKKTIYDPIVRRWDAGLARPFRFLAFAAWQCFAIPPMVWGATHEGHAAYAVGMWLWLSAMVAFLCGTYDRIDLERNARGKVRLVKTWYFCFFPRRPQTVDLVQYEGIETGQVRELGITDYVVLVSLVGFFLIPGVIWYIAFMQRDTWYVALTKDHGHPDLWLYRGWSELRAKQIASTLRTAVLPEYSWY